ncbi:thioesterase family protein [Aliikangiella coralliicola]|uniref:Medium/long-chain acyl-CoA thioesterase YigI n=1 Tax=Aliikangiella coralliicola TaxID=2592383 RepID=A0A545UFE7_9GAMM|nr:thioesterase family protein [Aliikangiella coralliicola]TQV88194.1 thioesterase family protein [Aliikangiella coralliicola]
MSKSELPELSSHDDDKYQQLLRRLADIFHRQIPFHGLIGFEFDELSPDGCRISFNKKPELIGNFMQGILHGGVTATALDVVGGTMAATAMLGKNLNASDEEIARKLSKVGTIDLRVDYVRPGKGEAFYAKARLLRSGNKVAVVRMELHSDDDTLVALGTGTYMTG